MTPQKSLKQKKLLDSFSEIIKYIPQEYYEVNNDTTLSNGFKVHIKTYTDMESSTLIEFENNTIITKNYYRNYIIHLEVSNDNTLIFKSNFDKNVFIKNFPSDKDFIETSILSGFWLDDNSLHTDRIFFKGNFCMPNSNICNDYILTINRDGSYTFAKTTIEEFI